MAAEIKMCRIRLMAQSVEPSCSASTVSSPQQRRQSPGSQRLRRQFVNGRTLYLSLLGGSCDEYLVSGTCSLVAVNAATGRQVGEPLPLRDDPTGMAATPDGRNLIIIGDESVTETRLAPDGTPSRPVALPGSEWGHPTSGCAMSPDGSILYVSVADGEDPGGLSFVRL
jgi:hypothetical protein